jgi:endonuclease G
VGSSSFTLSVTGNSFISSSVVKWNGTSLTTTYVSATQLNATVPAADVASAGTATVTVFTPTPGGGTSAGLTFTIYTVSSNVNLTMGNPSGATTDVNYPHNYLLDKPQFCAAYDRDKGIPIWTSWQVNSTWVNGPGVRKDNFIPDATLPSSWYHVVTGDYTGSNFSRGHMCPSADRINTQANNDAVFVMTNMIPQNQNNNGGPWEQLENYERTLANAGNVLYIISGGYGSGGTDLNGTVQTTIAGGKVTVPAKTWKVIMVLPAGTNDVSRVTTSTRCIAVIMNNDNGPFNAWGTYRVSVDYIESLTGFDFFSNVSPSIQAAIESVVDNGPTQ